MSQRPVKTSTSRSSKLKNKLRTTITDRNKHET